MKYELVTYDCLDRINSFVIDFIVKNKKLKAIKIDKETAGVTVDVFYYYKGNMKYKQFIGSVDEVNEKVEEFFEDGKKEYKNFHVRCIDAWVLYIYYPDTALTEEEQQLLNYLEKHSFVCEFGKYDALITKGAARIKKLTF